MTEVLLEAARRATAYLEGLPHRPVAPPAAAIAALGGLPSVLPDGPGDPFQTVRELDGIVGAATAAMAGPRYFGFVIGGSLPAALAANWLAGAWDQNAAFHRITPGVAQLEEVALRWLVDLLGLPAGCGGAFVTGATVANFAALAAARNVVLRQAGWNVEADGLTGAPGVTIIVGDEVHPSVVKALGLLGFGRNRLTRVPVDGQGRMRADRLPPLAGPTIICAQAGNVNTGASDPLAAICARGRAAGAWVHVDGAFGLWALAAPTRRDQLAGVAEADSWATDAHKWLNVPYDCGLAFVRDPHALQAAMAITADYLPAAGGLRNPSDFTPELSRRARGVEVWAALRTLGRAGIAALVERNCAQARRFGAELAGGGHEVLNEVALNQVLVAFGDAARTRRVIEAIQADGTCWCGPTVWQGRTAMRISVSSWATTEQDVTDSIAAIQRCAAAA